MSEGQLLSLTFILFNFLTNTKFTSTQVVVKKQKLIFRNEKPLRYSRDFVTTKFDITRFEIQSNIGEMHGNR